MTGRARIITLNVVAFDLCDFVGPQVSTEE